MVVRAVLTGRSTGWSFDLAWFNSVFWAPLSSVFMVLCIVSGYILYVSCQWAEPGVIGPWPGWLTVVLQCYDTVGWVIWPVKSSPKWPSVSSGTLNPTVVCTVHFRPDGCRWSVADVRRQASCRQTDRHRLSTAVDRLRHLRSVCLGECCSRTHTV